MIHFLLYVLSVTFILSVAWVFVFLAGRFALRDGSDLLAASMRSLLAGLVESLPELWPGSARLRHLQVQAAGAHAGVTAGRKLYLHARVITLGRSEHNHIVLTDPDVSGEHMSLSLERGHWWVTDSGSTNGTRLYPTEGPPMQVGDQPVRLAEGDVLQVGSVHLRLVP